MYCCSFSPASLIRSFLFCLAPGRPAGRPNRRPLLPHPPLSQVSNATGKLTVTPVCNFDQSDLCADDVMLLDTVTSVFVWVGPQANETERAEVRCGAGAVPPLNL